MVVVWFHDIMDIYAMGVLYNILFMVVVVICGCVVVIYKKILKRMVLLVLQLFKPVVRNPLVLL